MHYYKRNIGDYAKKAGRLSMLQHGSYTLLIDACYDREQFPTIDEAIEWTWASTNEEIEAVKFVLKRFFTLEDGCYVQNRIKEEVEAYQEKSNINKRIAHEREAKRKGMATKRERSVNEAPPNQEPLNTNQEPLNKEKKAAFKKPTVEEVKLYCTERKNGINADAFIDFYESNGWKVGKNSMKCWKSAIRTWEQRDNGTRGIKAVSKQTNSATEHLEYSERKYREAIARESNDKALR